MAKKRSTGCCVDAAYVEAASKAHARPLFIVVMGAWLRRVRGEAAPLVFGALPRRAQRFFARRATLAAGNTLEALGYRIVQRVALRTKRVVVPRQRNSSRSSRETLSRLPRRVGAAN